LRPEADGIIRSYVSGPPYGISPNRTLFLPFSSLKEIREHGGVIYANNIHDWILNREIKLNEIYSILDYDAMNSLSKYPEVINIIKKRNIHYEKEKIVLRFKKDAIVSSYYELIKGPCVRKCNRCNLTHLLVMKHHKKTPIQPNKQMDVAYRDRSKV
jgi:hypothetical protein